jgi:hypothetical protein
MNAAELIPPERVARTTLDACRRGEFLVLPHPEVREQYHKKCHDHDRWIDGMRRYQASLTVRAH